MIKRTLLFEGPLENFQLTNKLGASNIREPYKRSVNFWIFSESEYMIKCMLLFEGPLDNFQLANKLGASALGIHNCMSCVCNFISVSTRLTLIISGQEECFRVSLIHPHCTVSSLHIPYDKMHLLRWRTMLHALMTWSVGVRDHCRPDERALQGSVPRLRESCLLTLSGRGGRVHAT